MTLESQDWHIITLMTRPVLSIHIRFCRLFLNKALRFTVVSLVCGLHHFYVSHMVTYSALCSRFVPFSGVAGTTDHSSLLSWHLESSLPHHHFHGQLHILVNSCSPNCSFHYVSSFVTPHIHLSIVISFSLLAMLPILSFPPPVHHFVCT